MKYSYFPGCSLHSTAKEYDISTRAVAEAFGIVLEEVPEWVCCGATPAHITDHLISIALPVRNMLKVRDAGLSLMTCCAACYSRFKVANKIMREDSDHREKVNNIVEDEYNGEVKVEHFLEILLNDYGIEKIVSKIRKPLKGLKIASYYGCLLTRPPEVMEFDDPERPVIMDKLMETIGAEVVDWPYKTECCGASFSLTKTDIVLKLSGDILKMAKDEGTDCIVTACPLCQSNLDLRQAEIEKKFKRKFNVPILYFTQVLGLSLGIPAERLGLDKHIVNAMPLLREKGIV